MTDTICALATAPGGALGIVRVSGPKAFDAVSAISSVRCSSVAANTVHFTRLANTKGEIIDERKAKKVITFKLIPKTNSRRKKGHRQPFMRVKINSIG